ncbi:MAG TPA: ABC transporter substrate-binding protein [Polyangiaceae bacterium]|nr:ABC transporter substrate-binding protein [Polyangiaceae bacterium]
MRRSILPWVLAFSLAFPAVASAAEAENFMKGKHGELTSLVKQNKDKKLESLFDEVLDYDALAKASLGEEWDARSPQERSEFQALLTQLVRSAYRRNLKKTINYDIVFKGEEPGKGGVLVRTEARSRTNAREEPVAVDYLMHQVGGKWRIADIVTEGTSLVGNYRSQFRRVIKKHGFAELLKRMKSKAGQGGIE